MKEKSRICHDFLFVYKSGTCCDCGSIFCARVCDMLDFLRVL